MLHKLVTLEVMTNTADMTESGSQRPYFQLSPESTGNDAIPPGLPRTVEDLHLVAIGVATEAAALIATQRNDHAGTGRRMPVAQTKTSAVDPVTETDRNAESLIRQRLLEEIPGSVVYGEEDGGELAKDAITWIVDPIDGTVNFVYGIPAYAVSIAATWNGRPLAGAVIDVAGGLVYSASLGHAALVSPITQKDEQDATSAMTLGSHHGEGQIELSEALIATGFGYQAEQRAAQASLLTAVLPEVRDIRRVGSAALDLCMLAAGQVDGYYEHGLSAWDFAAGALIAARAGATISSPEYDQPSSERIPTIGGISGVYEKLRNLLVTEGVGGKLILSSPSTR